MHDKMIACLVQHAKQKQMAPKGNAFINIIICKKKKKKKKKKNFNINFLKK